MAAFGEGPPVQPRGYECRFTSDLAIGNFLPVGRGLALFGHSVARSRRCIYAAGSVAENRAQMVAMLASSLGPLGKPGHANLLMRLIEPHLLLRKIQGDAKVAQY
jgi:hypothetical protein